MAVLGCPAINMTSGNASPPTFGPLRTICAFHYAAVLAPQVIDWGKCRKDLLRALHSHGVYLVPKFMAPVHELIHVPLNIFRTLATPRRIDFYGYLFPTKSAKNSTDAGLKKDLSIPGHAQFHDFGQNGIATEYGLMR